MGSGTRQGASPSGHAALAALTGGLAIAALGALQAGGEAAAATVHPQGLIAYSSDQDDPNPLPPQGFPISPGKDFEIYSIGAGGANQQRLTSSPGNDQFLTWSPDGRMIAFEGDRDGDFDIYVMRADGSGVTQLTDDPAIDSVPSWSANGRRIAFTSFRDGDPEIYVMNADGSAERRITHSPGWDFSFGNWSRGRIVFNSDRAGPAVPPPGPLPREDSFDVYVMKADGTGVRRLTDSPGADAAPVWSPNGTRIAFTSARDGNGEIYVMRADGSHQMRITDNEATERHPSWSPLGRRLTFDSDRDGDFEIYVMRARGARVVQVTSDSAYDFHPGFAPHERKR